MSKQPNILFIFTDQHRLSAVGSYGPTPCRTPNLDQLAADGVRFETAYTVCPVSSPARGTLMTGRYPHSHGICSNVHNLGNSIHELEDRPDLLSRRLQRAGYALGYTGKWHLGTDGEKCFEDSNSPSLPSTVGFEGQDFPGHGGGGFNYPEYKTWLKEHGFTHELKPWNEPTPQMLPMGTLAGPEESTVPYFLTDHTIQLMDKFQADEKPFFIWHNFWGPHGPYFSPEEYVESYRDVEIPPWPNYAWPSRNTPGPHQAKVHPKHEELNWDAWATAVRHYYAFTTLIDAQIGRMLKHLEDTGLAENTIVVFSADHGETIGTHGGLSDKGWHHFEETHRIPMIARFPGDENKGKTIDSFVSLADLFPTFLDAAGSEYNPAEIHGRSLLPLIEGTAKDWRDDVVTEFGGVNSWAYTMRTIRHADLKYGFNCAHEDELYDLKRDPWETTNLIRDPRYQEAAQDMRSRLLRWMQETKDPARGRFQENKVRYYDR